jgi:two-component system nitrogen regulation sensor histidine kinase NtrY
VKNLKTIIGRFSDFAKMPGPQFENVDVTAVAESVLSLYRPQLQAAGGVEVVRELEPSPGFIEADPEQLQRALGSLVLNALDAMRQGGTLLVRTIVHEQGARIEVSDTGEGRTEEERARLFTPYYTTKRHGTGLGLAIVQSVVSDHHGRIAVESEPGRGTKFLLDLPATQPREGGPA